jgi:tetratricopeptide (TPR) repeat protein
MKTLFRVLTLGAVLTAFSALVFAQDQPDLATLFEQFKKEGPPAKTKCGGRSPALATGKRIVELFGADELNKEVIDFVKKRMADIEKEDPVCERENAYIEAFKAKNWANVFSSGKAIINAEGDSGKGLDVKLDLVSVGFDRAYIDKTDTFNAETLNLAKSALDAVNAGKPSNSKKYGAFVPFNTKEDTQSWLNYIIGWMMQKQGQQKEALTYFYKAAQVGTAKKNDTTIYTNIGKFYFDEAVELDKKYREMRKTNNNEDNDESKALLALARGTADRAADAFGRAYRIAAADPKLAQLKTTIAGTLTDLYKFRFNLADAKQADVDKYIADLVAKPMPDPASAVTPVVDATPTTATTSSTTSTTLNTTNAAATSNAATTTNNAATTPATTNKAATTPTKAATTVKKPVTKKKGTR